MESHTMCFGGGWGESGLIILRLIHVAEYINSSVFFITE